MDFAIPQSEGDTYGTHPVSDLREFHATLPLVGDPANDLLSGPDALLRYLLAAISDQPLPAPDIPLAGWSNFFRRLYPHRIIPLVAWNTRSWPEDCQPPEEIKAFLVRTLLVGGARNLRLGHQIRAATGALEEAGISSILLKGPALARTVYPDPALRHSSDIDLLVKPEDIRASEDVFAQLGYTCPEHTYSFAAHDRHHQVFYPPGQGSHVELHWVADWNHRMFSPGWLDAAFERKIRIESCDLSCYTLNPADHLSFLALHHVFMHQELRLDWICDIGAIAQCLTRPEDWEEIRSSCVSNHIRIPLQYALTAAFLWQQDNAAQLREDFSAWPSPTPREKTLWHHAQGRRSSLPSAIYLKLQGLPTMRDKASVCARYLFPPEEFLRQFRKSPSRRDIPLAYIRQVLRFLNYRS